MKATSERRKAIFEKMEKITDKNIFGRSLLIDVV